MIAGGNIGIDYDLSTTSTTCTASGTGYNEIYISEKEEEVEEVIIPEKATIFKANNRNIIRQNKFSSKQQFRNHRVRNR